MLEHEIEEKKKKTVKKIAIDRINSRAGGGKKGRKFTKPENGGLRRAKKSRKKGLKITRRGGEGKGASGRVVADRKRLNDQGCAWGNHCPKKIKLQKLGNVTLKAGAREESKPAIA